MHWSDVGLSDETQLLVRLAPQSLLSELPLYCGRPGHGGTEAAVPPCEVAEQAVFPSMREPPLMRR